MRPLPAQPPSHARIPVCAPVLLLLGLFGGCPDTVPNGNRAVPANSSDSQADQPDVGTDEGGDTPADSPTDSGASDDAGTGGGGSEIGIDPVLPSDPGAPRIFFSDISSGPAHGGEHAAGAIVTLYGNGFGEQRGDSTVTVGGVAAAAYPLWTNTRVAFQLSPQSRSGDVILNSVRGASNGAPFTVRDGRILCVATDGRDGAAGTFDDPWQTLGFAVDMAQPGDVIYALNGVTATREHRYSAALSVELGGTPDQPIALLAYPGATVTVSPADGVEFALRTPAINFVTTDHWVLAGLTLRGHNTAMEIAGVDWRVIGNDLSCPTGDGQVGCFMASFSSHLRFLGNDVHDAGVLRASKQYHAVYFTTDTVHVEAAWNHVHDNNTCRAIQFHSSPLCIPDCGPNDTTGFNQYDLIVHDNVIHGDACDGINFATVDPSRGPVEAFNNLIYDVGRGPDPADDGANYTGVFVAGYTNVGPDGTGVVEVYNNTIVNCGTRRGPTACGAIGRSEYSRGLTLRLRNNIIVQPDGLLYFSDDSDADLISGENNLWFGGGPGPAGLSGNLNADPLFVDSAVLDFRLRAESPAVARGATVDLSWDLAGAPRSAARPVDLGAFQLTPE